MQTTIEKMETALSPPGYTVAFETLGCKLNQYETDSIATTLRHRGFRVVPLGTVVADAYVINSCTVTNKADRKSRNTLYRVERFVEQQAQTRKGDKGCPTGENSPPIPVILTGCFVDSHPGFDRSSRRTTYLVDNRHKNTIPDLLEAHFRGETVDAHSFAPDVFGFRTPEQVFHTRTNVKIQDGCDNFCTFCIIPSVRGRAVSRSRIDILREAREAIAAGSRELVLTGVNMSRYRNTGSSAHHKAAVGDLSPVNNSESAAFVDLVEAILELPGDFRVRISSLEPDGLDDRFTKLFEHPRMCPHLHLCLQSGSDRILLAMRRMYTSRGYREMVERLRRGDSTFNLTTDLIAGFPGETEHDFEESIGAIREYGFGHVHVFPFSERAGTRADRMTGAIAPIEKRRRVERIQETAREEKLRYRRTLVGGTEMVLVEKTEETSQGVVGIGLGEHYVPVRFSRSRSYGSLVQPDIRPNRFYAVEITGIEAQGTDPRLIGSLPGDTGPNDYAILPVDPGST